MAVGSGLAPPRVRAPARGPGRAGPGRPRRPWSPPFPPARAGPGGDCGRIRSRSQGPAASAARAQLPPAPPRPRHAPAPARGPKPPPPYRSFPAADPARPAHPALRALAGARQPPSPTLDQSQGPSPAGSLLSPCVPLAASILLLASPSLLNSQHSHSPPHPPSGRPVSALSSLWSPGGPPPPPPASPSRPIPVLARPPSSRVFPR